MQQYLNSRALSASNVRDAAITAAESWNDGKLAAESWFYLAGRMHASPVDSHAVNGCRARSGDTTGSAERACDAARCRDARFGSGSTYVADVVPAAVKVLRGLVHEGGTRVRACGTCARARRHDLLRAKQTISCIAVFWYERQRCARFTRRISMRASVEPAVLQRIAEGNAMTSAITASLRPGDVLDATAGGGEFAPMAACAPRSVLPRSRRIVAGQ